MSAFTRCLRPASSSSNSSDSMMRGIGSYGNSRSWYSPFLYTPKRTPLRLSSRLMSPRLLTSSSANCRADRSVMATPCLTDTHAERLCSMILNSSQRMRPWFPHSLEKSTIMLRIGRAANGSPACRTSAFAPTPASTACAWRVYARPVRRARRRRDRRRVSSVSPCGAIGPAGALAQRHGHLLSEPVGRALAHADLYAAADQRAHHVASEGVGDDGEAQQVGFGGLACGYRSPMPSTTSWQGGDPPPICGFDLANRGTARIGGGERAEIMQSDGHRGGLVHRGDVEVGVEVQHEAAQTRVDFAGTVGHAIHVSAFQCGETSRRIRSARPSRHGW